MEDAFRLISPKILPPLDRGFRPASLANRAFLEDVAAAALVYERALGEGAGLGVQLGR